jgi:hypothetical protein
MKNRKKEYIWKDMIKVKNSYEKDYRKNESKLKKYKRMW